MKITNKTHYFEFPTQVKFFDPISGNMLGGIGYKREIICGCCGTTYAIPVLLINSYLETVEWENISETILKEKN